MHGKDLGMRRWWPAAGALAVAIPAGALTAGRAGLRETLMLLGVPFAFLLAGSLAPLLRSPPALAGFVWWAGATHTAAMPLSLIALGTSGRLADIVHTGSQVAYAVGFALLVGVAATFPRGGLTRTTSVLLIVSAVLPIVGALAGPSPTVVQPADGATTVLGPIVAWLPEVLGHAAGVLFVFAPVSAAVFVVRYLRADASLRRRMRLPFLGVAILAVLTASSLAFGAALPAFSDVVFLMAAPILPLSLVAGAAADPIPDVDRLLRRTAVFGGTWTVAAAAYGVGAAASAWSAGPRGLAAAIVLGSLLSLMLAAPVRRYLLRLADERTRLLADLQHQVRLLTQRTAELDESRRRLSEAADAERLRIERNLHDGVQQDALALMASVEVARATAGVAPDLDRVAAAARTLYESVRAVSHGIRPAVLDDAGLVAAVRSLASQQPLRVSMRVAGDEARRLPSDVESALYFFTAEALSNVAKHAGAGSVSIAILIGDQVRVEVRDDGCGGIQLAAGTGLRGLQDRLRAVGGDLEWRRHEGWTVVAAQVPA